MPALRWRRSSVVEQGNHNPCVGGSNPPGATNLLTMDPKLIFDVGVHRGDDSAYYLHKGFRVVGVEANPAMADALRKRFAAEIASGAYRLEEVGVAAEEGELDFWVCDDVSEWSSFDRNKAPSGGKTSRAVKVRTLPFARLLAKHGVPVYCKIDIEGNDHLC